MIAVRIHIELEKGRIGEKDAKNLFKKIRDEAEKRFTTNYNELEEKFRYLEE